MIQCEITSEAPYSLGEQAQMALEAGCRWLIIDIPDSVYATLRDEIKTVADICKEEQAFLTIVNNPEGARELGLHGVLLKGKQFTEVVRCRELLGPEAIIGFETGVDEPDIFQKLENADIDYAVVDYSTAAIGLINTLRMSGSQYPAVLRGFFTPDEITHLHSQGISGFEICDIFSKPDPEEYLSKLLSSSSI